MIARCSHEDAHGRCGLPEGHKGRHNACAVRHWCAVHGCDVRPAVTHDHCKVHGGKDGKARNVAPLKVHARPLTKRQKLALRKRRLMERAVVGRREGWLP